MFFWQFDFEEVVKVKKELIEMIEQLDNDLIIRKIFHLVKSVVKKRSSSGM